jgi:hypothetical protein
VTLTYLLPLRRARPIASGDELVAYVRELAGLVDEVLIVDGSPVSAFEHHAALLAGVAAHVRPDPRDACANGKAWAVLTGLREARNDVIVIADDDVRWDALTFAVAAAAVADADLVVPANFFAPMVWHTAWDSGRILLNRALGHDWPGTLVVRRNALRAKPPYDGNMLFENCELVRTVRAGGGRVCVRSDVLIPRRPPTIAHFLRQRPRQAYDDLAQPKRMAVMLAIIPLVALLRWPAAVGGALLAVAVAEVGRCRDGGRHVFPWYTPLCAPAWLAERAVLSWWALWLRLSNRGVAYSGTRLHRAATPLRTLRARLPAKGASAPAQAPP